MRTCILLWNPEDPWQWPADESAAARTGKGWVEDWRFWGKAPSKGDRVLIKRTGKINGIVASGVITEDGVTFVEETDENGQKKQVPYAKVYVDWVQANPEDVLPTSDIEAEFPGHKKWWNPMGSGYDVDPDDAYRLEVMWAEKIGYEHDMANVLRASGDIDQYGHDPAYELIQKAVDLYADCDFDSLTFKDLDFVYMMVHILKDPTKRKRIEESTLPQQKKDEMLTLFDTCIEKWGRGEYRNHNPEHSCGLFKPGFQTFDRKGRDDDLPAKMIKLLVDVKTAPTREAAYKAVEDSGIANWMGIAPGSLSEMLHCLRPEDFPVMNSHEGLKDIYTLLLPNKKRRGTTPNYMEWTRELAQMKDREFPFRNFRVIDLAQRLLGKKDGAVDYVAICSAMKKHAGDPWQKNPAGLSQADADALSELNADCDAAKRECKKLISMIELRFGLKSTRDVNFKKNEYSSVRHIRDYTWLEFKNPAALDSPISVSVFPKSIGGKGGKMAVSVQLEIYDADADAGAWASFHKHLDLPLNLGAGLSYSAGSNQYSNVEELNQQVAQIKSQIADGSLKKVAIIKVISVEPPATNEGVDGDVMSAIEAILPYYEYCVGLGNGAIPQATKQDQEATTMAKQERKLGLNTILYGPPGTGKTYNAVVWAVAICEQGSKTFEEVEAEAAADKGYEAVKARYDAYVKEGRIAFVTFHQSYGYEDFIEGIKPINANGSVVYETLPGAFKAFCEKAGAPAAKSGGVDIPGGASIWKVSLKSGKMNPIKRECFDEGYIRFGYSPEDEMGRYFSEDLRVGDIVLSLKTMYTIDAIGVVEGEAEMLENKPEYQFARKVKWLATDIDVDVREMNAGKQMRIAAISRMPSFRVDDVVAILNQTGGQTATVEEKKPFVFVIDEINRGNISKIFGELITLIEESKRRGAPEAMTARLPYSGEDFSVPDNVYILGTMNTADRSIALMDTALRRRFGFVEMMPEPMVLDGIVVTENGKSFDVRKALEAMNRRIEVLYDREHTLGHALFIGLKKEPTLARLASIFRDSIIPLLQEYFYEDYEKIQLVLGDNAKPDNLKFVRDIENKPAEVFRGNSGDQDVPEKRYEIQESAFYAIESYIEIVG